MLLIPLKLILSYILCGRKNLKSENFSCNCQRNIWLCKYCLCGMKYCIGCQKLQKNYIRDSGRHKKHTCTPYEVCVPQFNFWMSQGLHTTSPMTTQAMHVLSYHNCIWKIIHIFNDATITVEEDWRLCPSHDDVIKWKHFPRYWPFVRWIHRSPVNSPLKGQWRGALMFSLI